MLKKIDFHRYVRFNARSETGVHVILEFTVIEVVSVLARNNRIDALEIDLKGSVINKTLLSWKRGEKVSCKKVISMHVNYSKKVNAKESSIIVNGTC